MSKVDFEQLFTLLGRAIASVPGPRRDLEDAMGVGHGTLPRILDGRMDLKVHHLLALAKILDVPPGDFFTEGCPKATASARYHLADRLAPHRSTRQEKAAATAAGAGLDDLRPLLRQLIREEIASASPAAAAAPAGKKRAGG